MALVFSAVQATVAPRIAEPLTLRNFLSPRVLFTSAQHFVLFALPRILLIVLVAWLLVRALSFLTARVARVAEKHGASATRVQQARTLASVLRATGIGMIGIVAILQVMSLLGFNLGPLLASASIAGVAIGLACQTIVKDCLNGMLMLVEDWFSIGDWIRVAGFTGQVEGMSLRKTMLRDSDGTVYIIPNSQITIVANRTRDFSVSTVNVDVDFSADPDEVIKVLTEAAMSVRNDPQFADAFLEDPVLLGVDAIKGSLVTYPILLRTKANQQFAPRRELQRKVRLALELHHLLPGDPLRVFTSNGPMAVKAAQPNRPVETPTADPTAAPAKVLNPFTGGS